MEYQQCWAAKLLENIAYLPRFAANAVKSLKAVETYCPDIPHPNVYGELFESENSTFVYYFCDWIDGAKDWWMQDTVYSRDINGTLQYNLTYLDAVVRQTAQFLYNLTNCPIPEHECMSPPFEIE